MSIQRAIVSKDRQIHSGRQNKPVSSLTTSEQQCAISNIRTQTHRTTIQSSPIESQKQTGILINPPFFRFYIQERSSFLQKNRYGRECVRFKITIHGGYFRISRFAKKFFFYIQYYYQIIFYMYYLILFLSRNNIRNTII